MTQARTRLSFEEYLAYDDGTDTRYELVDGVLVEMGAESSLNLDIAFFLSLCLVQMGTPRSHIGFKTLIAVDSTKVTAREPDLVVHSEASKRAIASEKQAFLRHGMPVPLAVIEVVSPGEPGSDNYDRDYIEKPKEYAQRGISEFWQIDPERSVVSVLMLEGSSYKAKAFRGSDRIQSEQFKQFDLTAHQILSAGANQ
ncbi:MAG: Uma2 family endonuclease [Microcoleus sp. SIO2G3]|nr:Uma2 family endonuclease [Microcoleus sp. SIO2G3]